MIVNALNSFANVVDITIATNKGIVENVNENHKLFERFFIYQSF
jgi:hypothetical protein